LRRTLRLSVRFYLEDDFGAIAARYLAHVARMRIELRRQTNGPRFGGC